MYYLQQSVISIWIIQDTNNYIHIHVNIYTCQTEWEALDLSDKNKILLCMFQTIMFDMHQKEWQDKCIEFSQACLPVINILFSI